MSFEQADQALEQSIDTNAQAPSQSQEAVSVPTPQQQAMIELDKLEKFNYEGKEWTPKDLKNAMLRQEDYTRKTQSLAEERRFVDNLSVDLEKVARDPTLVDQFRSVYPEKYHHLIDALMSGRKPEQQAGQQEQVDKSRQSMDPEVLARIDRMEKQVIGYESEKIQAELDKTFDTMKAKYPDANETVVLAMARTAHEQGVKLDQPTWERFFKSEHDRMTQAYQSYYKKTVESQKATNLKGRDASSGGAIPGQAPKKMSFDEATKMAIQDLGR